MSPTPAIGLSAGGCYDGRVMKTGWAAMVLCGWLLLPWHVAHGLEFSAEQTTRNGTQSMTGKIFFKPDRWRVEMASPEGPRIAIHRLDKTVTWLLLPNRKYLELPLRLDQAPPIAPKIEGEVDRRRVGSEQVGGRNTDKYAVTLDVNGRKEVLYQWVATDINIPMKTASADGRQENAYSYVKVERQPDHLFELPPGYTQVPAR